LASSLKLAAIYKHSDKASTIFIGRLPIKIFDLKENKLISKHCGGFFMDNLNLIGVDYLWRVNILSGYLEVG